MRSRRLVQGLHQQLQHYIITCDALLTQADAQPSAVYRMTGGCVPHLKLHMCSPRIRQAQP